MTQLFMTVMDMSLTASYVIAVVILARMVLCLVNVPRRITYFLWAVVLLRLLIPDFWLSEHSILTPELTRDFTREWGDDYIGSTRFIHDSAEGFDAAVSHGNRVIVDETGARYVVTGADGLSHPKTVGTAVYPILSVLWVTGIGVMVLWNLIAMLRLRRRLSEAVPIAGDVFICDNIPTAFVLGLIQPRIYLPSNLTPDQQGHILLHERRHIRRGDHIIKAVAFCTLSLHWFNPLVWAAFTFAMEDMELSCDEAVTGSMEEAAKTAYAQTLLELTAGHRRFAVAPVAFGEGSTGQRIRHVYTYREPAKWLMVLLFVLVVVSMRGHLTDPYQKTTQTLGPAPYKLEKVVFARDTAPETGCLYLTTAKTAVLEHPDGTVTPIGTWTAPDENCGQWEQQLEETAGRGFDHIRCAITIRDEQTPGRFYVLTRHGYADEPVDAYLSYVDEAQGILWTVSTRPWLKFFGYPEELHFYKYSLEAMGLEDVEVFGTRHKNRMETRLFREYITDYYLFVGFTCDGGDSAGWALFKPDMGYDQATFTGQLQVYDADTNNGMILSHDPALLSTTGEFTDKTACDVVLVLNPDVGKVTALYDNNMRYSWPLEDVPAIVIMPWEYEGRGKTYLYFQDKNGSLVSDTASWEHLSAEEQTLFRNFGKLEELARQCLEDPLSGDMSSLWVYGVSDVSVFRGEHPMVQFETHRLGHQYSGFYYSPDDVPLPFQNAGVPLTETEYGWAWQGEGDNKGTTRRITKYWFSYTADF